MNPMLKITHLIPAYRKHNIFLVYNILFFRKHMFNASNRNIIKDRVEKKKLEQNCQKVTVFYFKL